MKKEMSLTANNMETSGLEMMSSRVAIWIRKPQLKLCKYYSKILNQKLTLKQTRVLVNAQAAFICAIMPADCSLWLRMVCGIWLVSALLKCKNAGLRTSD